MTTLQQSPLQNQQTGTTTIARNISSELYQSLQKFKLTLCIAPAGYGKTIVLQQTLAMLKHQAITHITLHLTKKEQLLCALDNSLQGQIKASAQMPTTEPSATRLTTVESLCAVNHPLIIIFNEWHIAQTPETAAYLSQLLNTANPHIHFWVITRKTPLFSYTKLLLENKAIIFGDNNFRFTEDEISAVISKPYRSPAASPEFIATIYNKTEGWPIAVTLYFQLMVNNNFNSLSGLDQTLSSYLEEEVISLLPNQLVKFAAQLAVLDQFSAPLAAYALPNPNASELIKSLKENNFYIKSLDRKGNFYRFHPIIKEHLLASRWASNPQQTNDIYLRAAKWEQEQGLEINAIEYALRAKDYDFLNTLITQSAQKMARDFGFSQKIIEWCEKIPLEYTTHSIAIHFWLTWSLTFSCHYIEAKTNIENLENHLSDLSMFSSADREIYTGHLAALKVAFISFTDKAESIKDKADDWLKEYRLNGDPFDISMVAGARFIGAQLQLDSYAARESLSIAKANIPLVDSPYGEMWVHALDGLCEMEFGNYNVAYKIFKTAYLTIQPSGIEISPIRSTVALLYAKTCYELGHTDIIGPLLEDGFAHINDHGITASAAAGIFVDFKRAQKISFNNGLHALSKAELISANHTPRLLFFIRKLRTELYLKNDDLDTALIEAELAGVSLQKDGSLTITDVNCPLMAAEKTRLGVCLLYSKARYKSAAKEIRKLLASPQTTNRPLFMTECLILQCAILLKTQEKISACRLFNKALKKSVSHGFYQTFIDYSDYTQPVLEELLKYRKTANLLPEDQLIERISTELCIQPKAIEQAPRVDANFSPRELELLTLLQSTLNIQEIADYLFLSKATIKWHLNNIYKKLYVNNRSGAINRAQKLNLID